MLITIASAIMLFNLNEMNNILAIFYNE